MMPPAFFVAVLLIGASIAMLLSPMPARIRQLVGLSLAMVGIVYISDALNLLSMTDKAFSLRYSLIGFSAVIIICVAAWRLGGPKIWKQ
jgi:hypothetical protein